MSRFLSTARRVAGAPIVQDMTAAAVIGLAIMVIVFWSAGIAADGHHLPAGGGALP